MGATRISNVGGGSPTSVTDDRYLNESANLSDVDSASTSRSNLGISATNTPIADAGSYYSGTDVETALQEIGSGTTLDSRYVNVTGDTMTGVLKGFFTISTRAAILALSTTVGEMAYATDTKQFFIYDGTNWREAPLELDIVTTADETGVDMGAYVHNNGTYQGLGTSDKSHKNSFSIFGHLIASSYLSNTVLKDNTALVEEGAIRVNSSTFQIYLNSVWNDVVINFRFREDDDGSYELEHKPIGLNEWIEVLSGNSDVVGLNDLPIVQNYTASMGVYPERLAVGGATF